MTNLKLETEQNLANQIIQLEKKILSLLYTFDDIKHLVENVENTPRKHNANSIEKMEEALFVLKTTENIASHKKQIRKLDILFKRAEELRWELALSAEHIAKIEARRMSSYQLSQEDLEQEGILGLLEAAKRYDPEKNIRFTTYARWWVRAQMTRCIENTGRLVRIPGGAIEQIRNLQRLIETYKSHNKEVDLDVLATELGISRKRTEFLLSQQGTISMDNEDTDGRSFSDTLPNQDPSLEEYLIKEEALQLIQEKFTEHLDKREQFILTHHFGLDENPKQTMREIGEQISLSKERVRQIEAKAISKLQELFL